MIDIIESAFSATQVNQVLDRSDEVFVRNDALPEVHVDPEFLINLIAPDTAEVVFLWVEKEPFQEGFRIRNSRRIAWAQFPVNIFQSLFLIMGRIFFQGLNDSVII